MELVPQVRVMHSRSLAARDKEILAADLRPLAAAGFAVLRLATSAGLYVKEFVHGDFGRTSPSVGEILGCEADILQLDVTDIEMAFGGDEEALGEEE